jgi:hypothetical protein
VEQQHQHAWPTAIGPTMRSCTTHYTSTVLQDPSCSCRGPSPSWALQQHALQPPHGHSRSNCDKTDRYHRWQCPTVGMPCWHAHPNPVEEEEVPVRPRHLHRAACGSATTVHLPTQTSWSFSSDCSAALCRQAVRLPGDAHSSHPASCWAGHHDQPAWRAVVPTARRSTADLHANCFTANSVNVPQYPRTPCVRWPVV